MTPEQKNHDVGTKMKVDTVFVVKMPGLGYYAPQKKGGNIWTYTDDRWKARHYQTRAAAEGRAKSWIESGNHGKKVEIISFLVTTSISAVTEASIFPAQPWKKYRMPNYQTKTGWGDGVIDYVEFNGSDARCVNLDGSHSICYPSVESIERFISSGSWVEVDE